MTTADQEPRPSAMSPIRQKPEHLSGEPRPMSAPLAAARPSGYRAISSMQSNQEAAGRCRSRTARRCRRCLRIPSPCLRRRILSSLLTVLPPRNSGGRPGWWRARRSRRCRRCRPRRSLLLRRRREVGPAVSSSAHVCGHAAIEADVRERLFRGRALRFASRRASLRMSSGILRPRRARRALLFGFAHGDQKGGVDGEEDASASGASSRSSPNVVAFRGGCTPRTKSCVCLALRRTRGASSSPLLPPWTPSSRCSASP